MKPLYVLGILFVFIAVAALVYANSRFIKTVYLIARVSPYEQAGQGAGSIQVLGDSTGYGTGATESKYSVAGLIGTNWPEYEIKNQSVNGRTIGGLLNDTADFSGNFDVILLQIGANDILQQRDFETVFSELRQLLARLEKHTDHIVMISSGNIGASPAYSGAEAVQYTQLSREYQKRITALDAETENFIYIDLFKDPEDDPFIQKPAKYTSIDGLHPSDEGYQDWYEKIEPELERILQ